MNKELIKENVEEMFNNSDDVNDLIEDLYTDEKNFNNCDKESGERIMTEGEIKVEVLKVVEEIKTRDDRCSSCGALLSDDDFYGDYETMTTDPYPMQQFIAQGYNCPHCGETERL